MALSPSKGGGEIGARRALVVGSIKMLRTQKRVFAFEPFDSLEVQGLATRSQQRRVSAFLDQRVREQKILALRQRQGVADEPVADIAWIADQMPKQRQIEPLADDGGGLKSLALTPRQPVHARLYEAVNGRRNGHDGSLPRVPQQLLQEQRIAARPFDAGLGNALRGVDEASSEGHRVLGVGFRRAR